jgi:hypothetical protein
MRLPRELASGPLRDVVRLPSGAFATSLGTDITLSRPQGAVTPLGREMAVTYNPDVLNPLHRGGLATPLHKDVAIPRAMVAAPQAGKAWTTTIDSTGAATRFERALEWCHHQELAILLCRHVATAPRPDVGSPLRRGLAMSVTTRAMVAAPLVTNTLTPFIRLLGSMLPALHVPRRVVEPAAIIDPGRVPRGFVLATTDPAGMIDLWTPIARDTILAYDPRPR